MRIQILQEDIDKGKQRNAYECPIACALKRQFPKAIYVSVGSAGLMNLDFWYYDLPKEAMNFINYYDIYGSGEPFEFEVGAPVGMHDTGEGD